MKYTAYIFKALFAIPVAASLTFSACSDTWNEHYNPEAQNQISGESLWATIESNPNLSNFASVLKAAGYDKSLASAQSFSVFAPVNSVLSAEEAQNLINTYNTEKAAGTKDDENTTIKEFVQNHIALYNHSVSSESKDSLVMMNGKYQILTSGTFANKGLLTSNTACANGVLYTLDGQATYSPNVFEYLGKDADLDSVANFLYYFNKYEFDAANSVPGEIVDGKTVYLDSVTNLVNSEMKSHLGPINSEDSSYWVVAPTNDVWNKYVPEYENYFVYDETVNKRDSIQWANARFQMLTGTVFNRTYNPDNAIQDSVVSTNAVRYSRRLIAYGSYDLKYYQYDKPYASDGIFNGAVVTDCSNGKVLKNSTWNFKPTDTYYQTIIVEGENTNRLDSIETDGTKDQKALGSSSVVNVSSSNPFYGQLGSNSYIEITPSGNSNIKSYFSLPDMLSNIGYDIYVVTAPALAGDTLATATQRLPTKFVVYFRTSQKDGTVPQRDTQWTRLDGKDNNSSQSKSTFTTTADAVDTFKVGNNIKIPYTTYGLSSSPKTELIFYGRPTAREVSSGQFNRILRIDKIIVKPHEDD